MQFFIPSLILIVLAAVIVMFVIPRLSPVILGVLALVFLLAAIFQHYYMFGTEYRLSTWQLPLTDPMYVPYILLGILILFLLFFIINFIGTGSTDMSAPLKSMNAAMDTVMKSAPTVNSVTNAVNRSAANASRQNTYSQI
jgi:hypothetical protein